MSSWITNIEAQGTCSGHHGIRGTGFNLLIVINQKMDTVWNISITRQLVEQDHDHWKKRNKWSELYDCLGILSKCTEEQRMSKQSMYSCLIETPEDGFHGCWGSCKFQGWTPEKTGLYRKIVPEIPMPPLWVLLLLSIPGLQRGRTNRK